MTFPVPNHQTQELPDLSKQFWEKISRATFEPWHFLWILPKTSAARCWKRIHALPLHKTWLRNDSNPWCPSGLLRAWRSRWDICGVLMGVFPRSSMADSFCVAQEHSLRYAVHSRNQVNTFPQSDPLLTFPCAVPPNLLKLISKWSTLKSSLPALVQSSQT